jgi:hypothetical protein
VDGFILGPGWRIFRPPVPEFDARLIALSALAFSLHFTNPWGVAPACNESAPLALTGNIRVYSCPFVVKFYFRKRFMPSRSMMA